MQKVKVGVLAVEPLEPMRFGGGHELLGGVNGVSVDDLDSRVMCEDCQAFGAKTVVQRCLLYTSDAADE